MKRALRNFGNVLGNCLYDKDYLARVTKVKTAPSKWDAENLHRHPDYAPVKRELGYEPEPEEKPTTIARTHSTTSMGGEFEDEFGANLFDGVELAESREEEATLPAHASREGSIDQGQNNPRLGLPQHTAMPPPRRTASGPPEQQQQRAPSNPCAPLRPQFPVNPAPPSHPEATERGRPNIPAPTNNNHTRQTSPQKNDQPANSNSAVQILQKSLPQNQHSTPPNQILTPGHAQTTENVDFQPTPQQHNPHDPPPGFITSRAAEMINKQEPLPANVRFNPKAESPSIPRTIGVNHATSAPVMRDAIKTGAAGPPPAGGIAGPAARMNPPNFVNPSDNLGRRIGMPGAGLVSPHNPNRSAYKPPSMAGGKRLYSEIAGPGGPAARPPLADVSNVTGLVNPSAVHGGEDVKKARLGDA